MDELLEKATNWWIEKMENPVFDNGDTSSVGNTAKMLFNVLPKIIISEKQKELFKEKLSQIITENLLKYGYLNISVDYQMDIYLQKVCDFANIPIQPNTFPCKTSMNIWPNKIKVKQGYEKPYDILFEK